jgi:hypothetical protein
MLQAVRRRGKKRGNNSKIKGVQCENIRENE